MIYRKNLYGWEQMCRVVLGLALAAGAWWALPHGLLAYGLIASGAILAVTGVVGFCPMCAIAGRRPVGQSPVPSR